MKLTFLAVLTLLVALGMSGLQTTYADQSQNQVPRSLTTDSGNMQGTNH